MCVPRVVDKTVHVVLVADLLEGEEMGEEGSSSFDHGPRGCPALMALAMAAPWVRHRR